MKASLRMADVPMYDPTYEPDGYDDEALADEARHQCGELLLKGHDDLARETYGDAFVDAMLAEREPTADNERTF